MSFGSAYVNSKNLRVAQQRDRERVHLQAKQVQIQKDAQAAQERQFSEQMAHNRVQADRNYSLAVADQSLRADALEQSNAQFQQNMALQTRRLDQSDDQFDATYALKVAEFDASQQSTAYKQQRQEAIDAVGQNFLAALQAPAAASPAISYASAAPSAAAPAMTPIAATAGSPAAAPMATADAAATDAVAAPRSAEGFQDYAGRLGSPAAASEAPARPDVKKLLTDMATQYAVLGETARANTLLNIVETKKTEQFEDNAQAFMQGMQYLNNGDDLRAAKVFTEIINETALYNQDFRINPDSIEKPSAENDGKFAYTISNDKTGEKYRSEYASEEELFGFLLGNANPAKAVDYLIGQNSDVRQSEGQMRVAKAKAQTQMRKDAISYATKRIEALQDPLSPSYAQLSDAEMNVKQLEFVAEYENMMRSDVGITDYGQMGAVPSHLQPQQEPMPINHMIEYGSPSR